MYIYLMFSSTKNKMGQFIRFFTKAKYNHVSFAFCEDLSDLRSFARYYYACALYGGYIKEGKQRYQSKNQVADIALYRIEVSQAELEIIKKQIHLMDESANQYIYDHINAILNCFKCCKKLSKAYTCLSFVLSLLSHTNVLANKQIYAIEDLMKQLKQYQIYEGSIINFKLSDEPTYFKKISFLQGVKYTLRQLFILLTRL